MNREVEIRHKTITDVITEGFSKTVTTLENEGLCIITKNGIPVAMLQSLTMGGHIKVMELFNKIAELEEHENNTNMGRQLLSLIRNIDKEIDKENS